MLRHKVSRILPLLLLFNLAGSHNPEDSAPNQIRNRPSDPVSKFFSELGDLFLDVDQAIAVQNEPKIEHEANVMSRLLRPRQDYFNRIQNNYKEMQKRLGTLIGNTIGFRSSYSDHELSTVSPPSEGFIPTIGPDHNPFAAAAEDRKVKLKQRITKTSFEPKRISQTIDNSLKAFGKLSQAIIDDIGDISRERKLSKSVSDEKNSPKRSGSIEFEEECSNVVLEDPDLEKLRQERCSQVSAEKLAREDMRKLKEPKLATETLPKNTDSLNELYEKGGDSWIENDTNEGMDRTCSNEVLEDPDLEQRRQERCSLIAAQERIREFNKLMLEPMQVTGDLFSKSTTLDKLFKGDLGRSGDSLVENDISKKNNGENSEAVEHVQTSKDECSEDVLEDSALENIKREKCARIAAEERLIKDLNKILKESKKASQQLFPFSSKAIDDFSFLKRSGNTEDKSSDDVFLNPSLDKQIRQLIKDHGSWILDYPLIKRWRQRGGSIDTGASNEQSSDEIESTTVDSSNIVEVEPTEFYLPVSADYEMALQKSGDSVPVNPHESSYYRIINQDGDIMEEEIDFVLDPESISNDIEEIEPKETVILAFTADGVPLKLRLGQEIDNPIQYLHKLLQSAGVFLNIPVESYDDLEPVGKEVLKLGSGILTRAVLIDASDSNEMKSLLKALMASKTTGKTLFL